MIGQLTETTVMVVSTEDSQGVTTVMVVSAGDGQGVAKAGSKAGTLKVMIPPLRGGGGGV